MHFIYSCIQNDSTSPETAVLYILYTSFSEDRIFRIGFFNNTSMP